MRVVRNSVVQIAWTAQRQRRARRENDELSGTSSRNARSLLWFFGFIRLRNEMEANRRNRREMRAKPGLRLDAPHAPRARKKKKKMMMMMMMTEKEPCDWVFARQGGFSLERISLRRNRKLG